MAICIQQKEADHKVLCLGVFSLITEPAFFTIIAFSSAFKYLFFISKGARGQLKFLLTWFFLWWFQISPIYIPERYLNNNKAPARRLSLPVRRRNPYHLPIHFRHDGTPCFWSYLDLSAEGKRERERGRLEPKIIFHEKIWRCEEKELKYGWSTMFDLYWRLAGLFFTDKWLKRTPSVWRCAVNRHCPLASNALFRAQLEVNSWMHHWNTHIDKLGYLP